MQLEKNKEVPKSLWPLALKNVTEEEIKVIYTPWSDHDVKIPENYQIKIEGELPIMRNYIEPDFNRLVKIPGILENSYAQLRGISATGKGTRIALLLQVLMDTYAWQLVFDELPNYHKLSKMEKNDGVPPPVNKNYVGIKFPELNLLILGVRIVKSNKSRLLSITGADTITSGLSHETLFLMLKRYAHMNILYEGYTGLDNGRLNIKEQVENGQSNFFMQFYQHVDKEAMLERFKSRSYHVAKGDSAFSQNKNHGEYSYQINKEEESLATGKTVVELCDSNTPPEEFVKDYLTFLGLNGSEMYKLWKERFPTVDVKRDYRNPKQNYDLYWYLWQFIDQETKKEMNK